MSSSMAQWSRRRWTTAGVAAAAIALLVGLPTDVIPNPVFGRPVPVTWWSYPVLFVTAVLGGLLTATYVRDEVAPPRSPRPPADGELDRPGRAGGAAGLLSFFAVGCPVCNKLVVIALGTAGARQWFEPLQPWLAALSTVLLALALRARLRGASECRLPVARV
jgi:hypothetical protein